MPETKSKFLGRILDSDNDGKHDGQSFTKERQHTAQAFNLHVEQRDGRCAEGFAWSHYVGYKWTDEGEHERLIVIFGMRALEVLGEDLDVLVAEIREGKLNSIYELASGRAQLLKQANPDKQPIITSVKSYPDFDDILREIKGEEEDDKHRHVKRVAGR
jgi:hypothetical protein